MVDMVDMVYMVDMVDRVDMVDDWGYLIFRKVNYLVGLLAGIIQRQQFVQPQASQSQTSTRSQLPRFVKCAYLWLRTLGDPPKFGVLGDLKMSSIFFRNSSYISPVVLA